MIIKIISTKAKILFFNQNWIGVNIKLKKIFNKSGVRNQNLISFL